MDINPKGMSDTWDNAEPELKSAISEGLEILAGKLEGEDNLLSEDTLLAAKFKKYNW